MNRDDRLAHCALTLAGEKGWDTVTLSEIARRLKTSLADLRKKTPDTDQLGTVIASYIDRLVARQARDLDPRQDFYNRLLDITLARLEILQKYRKGILALTLAARRRPKLAFRLLRAQRIGLTKMLAYAKIPSSLEHTRAFRIGFFLAFHIALRRWAEDETNTLEKTCAALDRSLRKLFSLCCENGPFEPQEVE
jgi:AcrR family transcriptional regulator